MKIISAISYGFRTVIRVVTNPGDPESVHDDGSPHSGDPPEDVAPGLRPWEWCHECRYNWDVREFIWDRDDQYFVTASGNRVLKGQAQLLVELKERLTSVSAPAVVERMRFLEGLTL